MSYGRDWDRQGGWERHDDDRSGAALNLAYGLGWFSIGLGLAELLAPRQVARATGMQGSESLLQLYGVREIGTGIAILASDNPRPWIWARVAGDALDLATLATGLSRDNPRRENVGMAMGAVAGVTALDVICAEMLDSGDSGPPLPLDYYRSLSGFPAAPEEMRGAASDFEAPADFRTPEALRPFPEGMAAAGVASAPRGSGRSPARRGASA